ncbi:MAG: pilus assembly protein [Nocardioides sp.]|uniref:TadE/TadG family type IV pilus assembly protein n=1 Tax=Nocardioides sp. TaxID=35761 RepID=UPI002389967D|nr:TadE family protein [Nocardioides sp.]MDE0778236.1 pilus assembly protein [Nocardioides sp.]
MNTPMNEGRQLQRGPHPLLRFCPRRHRGERGAAGVEFLIVATVLIFMFTTLVQYGIRLHGQRVAEAAAREGAVAAARYDGTEGSGSSTAQGYVDDDGKPAVTGSSVSVSRSATEARVSVTVDVVTLAPWLGGSITSTATAPVERFVE